MRNFQGTYIKAVVIASLLFTGSVSAQGRIPDLQINPALVPIELNTDSGEAFGSLANELILYNPAGTPRQQCQDNAQAEFNTCLKNAAMDADKMKACVAVFTVRLTFCEKRF